MSVIEVEKLTRTYRNGKGIYDVSFTVAEGEVFGYLGPNGSGKTTTIRQLMGFTNAQAGICRINGLDCRRQAPKIHASLGYLPGEIAFFDGMTGLEFLWHIGDMRGMRDRTRPRLLMERFDLDASGKILKMSKGMKQKLGIVAAFMHDPSIYILDEPTSSLDPLMQKTFTDLVLEEKARGKTILMSSHNFSEVERTADRAGIIRDGRLVAVEDISSLKESQRRAFIVTLASEADVEGLRSSGLEIRSVAGRSVEVTVGSDYGLFISALSRCMVQGIDVLPQTLEQVFMGYYC